MSTIQYDTAVTLLDGTDATLEPYRGEVMLIVNTASECGFTPQYAGLEELHKKYAERGLRVLGFPCDQFGGQEPGDAEQIGAFCQKNYGVSFAMFSKIEVNGDNAHPLFEQLKQGASGVLGTKNIKWNFTKFLVGRDGTIVDRYAPSTKPEKIAPDIEKLLA